MSKQEDMEDQYPKNIWKCFDDSTKQEEFVLNVLNEKENGYFVEVGSHHPQINNNTYNLEKKV